MRSRSCFCRNLLTTSGPNVKLTPRSFSLQPVMSLSGSDHKRSQRRPNNVKANVSQTWAERTRSNPRRTGIGNIRRPHDLSDLVHVLQIRRKTTVHSENLFVDDCGYGQAVEAVGEGLPELDVVSPLACEKIRGVSTTRIRPRPNDRRKSSKHDAHSS